MICLSNLLEHITMVCNCVIGMCMHQLMGWLLGTVISNLNVQRNDVLRAK